MNLFKTASILFCIVLLVALTLPENVEVAIPIPGKPIAFIINPMAIDLRAIGIPFVKEFRTRLGLDLQGGSHLVFEADTKKINIDDIPDAVNASRDVIERRVNYYGVSEPVVQTVKSGTVWRVTVDLPGASNTQEAVELIGKTAQLLFTEDASPSAEIASDSAMLERLTKDTGLTGREVKKAGVVFDPESGRPRVSLTFSDKGEDLFEQITERNVGKPVAIYLDEFLLSAPVVQQKISGGNAVITGSFTTEGAKQLAVAINSGALPLPITLVEQRSIGPTLGKEEVDKSVTAGVIGLCMVLVFMVAYYGRMGIVASIALLTYGLISFAIFRAIPIVLTLSGIAGFILSIGMAVDSNILIFERIREELRKGAERDDAIRLGFGRAIDAIKDANFTTLLVAFILFNPLNWDFLPQFGMVRGFALTLGIGVATSLFTGVVITRRLLKFFYRNT